MRYASKVTINLGLPIKLHRRQVFCLKYLPDEHHAWPLADNRQCHAVLGYDGVIHNPAEKKAGNLQGCSCEPLDTAFTSWWIIWVARHRLRGPLLVGGDMACAMPPMATPTGGDLIGFVDQ